MVLQITGLPGARDPRVSVAKEAEGLPGPDVRLAIDRTETRLTRRGNHALLRPGDDRIIVERLAATAISRHVAVLVIGWQGRFHVSLHGILRAVIRASGAYRDRG